VISPEDLVIAKLLAGRPKDTEDARGVLRAQRPGLDTARVERVLGLLEEALGQSDLLLARPARARPVAMHPCIG
jgi:hypothetical protein